MLETTVGLGNWGSRQVGVSVYVTVYKRSGVAVGDIVGCSNRNEIFIDR